MSASVGSPALSHDSSKWKLAERLERNSTLPKDTLRGFFDGIADDLLKSPTTTFTASHRESAWNTFSSKRLESIHTAIITAVYNNILSGVSEGDAANDLARNNCTYGYRICLPGEQTYQTVVGIAVLEYFESNCDELTLEIQSLLKTKEIEPSETQ